MANNKPAKRTRRRHSLETKKQTAKEVVEAIRQDPKTSIIALAPKYGIQDTQLRHWLNDYGEEFGWRGTVQATAEFLRSVPPPTSAGRPANVAAPDVGWLAKNGDQLLLAMRVGEASEQDDEDEPGSAVNDDDEPEAPAATKTLLSRPTPPRGRSQTVSAPERRPSTLMRTAPYAEREVVETRCEPPPPNEFEQRALGKALRDREALMTVLEMMFTEGRAKFPVAG